MLGCFFVRLQVDADNSDVVTRSNKARLDFQCALISSDSLLIDLIEISKLRKRNLTLPQSAYSHLHNWRPGGSTTSHYQAPFPQQLESNLQLFRTQTRG